MASSLTRRFRLFWLSASFVDLAAFAVVILYVALRGASLFYSGTPQSLFLTVLAICSLVYLTIRGGLWARKHLLWSLRNRLVAAYIFIAVVPVLLLLAMAGLAAYLLYWQLGSYLLYTEMQERVDRVSTVAGAMATSYAVQTTSGHRAAQFALPVDPNTYLKNAMTELPGLKVDTGVGEDLLPGGDGPLQNRYRGIVFSGGVLILRSVVIRQTPAGRLVVSATVPVTPELLETLAPELGPIRFEVVRARDTRSNKEVSVVVNRRGYTEVQQMGTQQRSVPGAANPFDKLITGIVILDVLDEGRGSGDEAPLLVVASFSTRPSLLNRKLFSPLGQLGGVAATALLVVGAVFLLIEFASLVTGITMTRTITSAVGDLYSATQHVQAGDLSYRVRVPHRDQLAALGESFNSMTESVSTLIEEQRKRQRLENELSIAQEVQQQLFPHTLPKLPGVEVEAICRPARSVSGDYYDFIRISPTRLAIGLADISGKGISAALLMANVQAALRSDVLRYRDGPPAAAGQAGNQNGQINAAEIVSHLNRHLFRNSSTEHYATFFFGVYDTQTRRLCYTNAGHPPPVYISGGSVKRLEIGGTVVGLFDGVPFEQGMLEVEPGGILIAYSDGLIEAENAQEEEFGTERLIDVAIRSKGGSPHDIAEAMMHAAEEWSGTSEQGDDMTVIVLHFSETPQEIQA